MIKKLLSVEYKDMSKQDVMDILHEYLDSETAILIKQMHDYDMFMEPNWDLHQAALIAEVKRLKKIKAFLPNQGK
jgi:hypothetical protein